MTVCAVRESYVRVAGGGLCNQTTLKAHRDSSRGPACGDLGRTFTLMHGRFLRVTPMHGCLTPCSREVCVGVCWIHSARPQCRAVTQGSRVRQRFEPPAGHETPSATQTGPSYRQRAGCAGKAAPASAASLAAERRPLAVHTGRTGR